MSWITLTASDLSAYLVAAQLEQLRTAALGAGQVDPFPEVAQDVIAKTRAYIASNSENLVDASPATIPPELKLDVVYIILSVMLGRLGIALTEDQGKQVDRAQSTLIALRDRKLVVSRPSTPIAPDVQGGTSVEVARSTPRRVTRDSMEGLL